MKATSLFISLPVHLLAGLLIAFAGLCYGVVSFGLTTPQFIYELIASGLPVPALLASFLGGYGACVLIAQWVFKSASGKRAAFWACYLAGGVLLFQAGKWLTTLNPMIDLPAPLSQLVIAGTAVETIALLLCLAAAALIAAVNRSGSDSSANAAAK